MKIFITLSGIIFVLTAFSSRCLAIEAWPGGAGTNIATYSDASGAVWNETRQSLFIVQNSGTLVEINSSGTELNSWPVAGDLEGITLAENDRYFYIGIENPDSIVEFDLQTGTLTGKAWNLTPWMASSDPNQGLEGLGYRDGYFYAGLQADGKIYVFNVNLNVSGEVSHVETFAPYAPYSSDVSGIETNADTGLTYVTYDTYNALLELNASKEIVKHYSLPGTAQEGFALKTNCLSRTADVFVTNDDTGIITKYTNYPITCLDADGDGVDYTSDCNDYNAAISSNRTYYRDFDGDGLGANNTVSVCSLTAPTGYVTNLSDGCDDDFDNDGTMTGYDCNDHDSSISQKQIYWRDADTDGLGDAYTTTETCSFTAPSGYVTNASDPADISASGRWFQINGMSLDPFGFDPLVSQYTDLNYYSDEWHEIIAVGLITKKAYITLIRVQRNNVAITKRAKVKIKKKHQTIQLSTQLSNNKFTTRFGGGKKYTWKVSDSGFFKKSK